MLSRRKIIAAFAFLLGSAGNAFPQAGAPALCNLNASFDATLKPVENDVFLKEISSRCIRGDVVSFPKQFTYIAKKACDFSMQIVNSSSEVICVYSGAIRQDRPR